LKLLPISLNGFGFNSDGYIRVFIVGALIELLST